MIFIEQIYKKPSNNYKGVVFLDRDGVLIKDPNYLREIKQVEILPGVIEGLKLLKKNGFIFIVITNQAVVARGYITIPELKKINDYIASLFIENGIVLNAIYSCPHHPNADKKEYRTICACRKPGIEMFDNAKKTFLIDYKKAFMVGDNQKDIDAGERLGLQSFQLTKDKDFLDVAKQIISLNL